MAANDAPVFKAAMIQMRSGVSPEANLDAATKLITQAKAAGAHYVQTPEVTNIFESCLLYTSDAADE